jgi:hypothetical protein
MKSQLEKNNTIKLALLTAMYFNRPMRRTELDYITYGFAVNQSALITNLTKEGKIEKVKNLDEEYKLTKKGLNVVNDTFIDFIQQKKTGEKQVKHNLAISRAIMLIMLTFPKTDIQTIKKEKDLNNNQTPDITVETKDKIYYIEVDTGLQKIPILKNKITQYKLNNLVPIFLTKSNNTYKELKDNKDIQTLALDEKEIFNSFKGMIYNETTSTDKQSNLLHIDQIHNLQSAQNQEPEAEKTEGHEAILDRFFRKK